MVKKTINNVQFVSSASRVEQLPALKKKNGEAVPEVAVLGRSNVGKSSLLNMLFQQHNLVKTSSTPGKTQLLNLFAYKDVLAFTDLPGFGYAAASHAVRRQWAPMIQKYFERREALQLVLFLYDIRRDPTEEDRALMEWLFDNGLIVILVVTKSDKVSKGQILGKCKKIAAALGAETIPFVACSALKKEGREELLKIIFGQLKAKEESE